MRPNVVYKKLVSAVRNVDEDAIEGILSAHPTIMAWHDYAILKQETQKDVLEIFFQHGLSIEKAQVKLLPQIIHKDNAELLQYMHTKGMDINNAQLDVLRKAIEQVSMDVVKYMLQHGTYNPQDYKFEVQQLYFIGNTTLLDLLPKTFVPQHVNSCLVNIMAHGYLKHVKRLIKLGADLHYQNDMPILRAFGERRSKIVKYILDSTKVDLLGHDGFMIYSALSVDDEFGKMVCEYLYHKHPEEMEKLADQIDNPILQVYKNKIIMDRTVPVSQKIKNKFYKI